MAKPWYSMTLRVDEAEREATEILKPFYTQRQIYRMGLELAMKEYNKSVVEKNAVDTSVEI